MADNDDFIVAPNWAAPAAAASPAPPVAEPEPEVITLPPGIADSVTHQLPPERQRTPPAKPEVSFFPGAIGAPVPSAPPPPPPGYAAAPAVAPEAPPTSPTPVVAAVPAQWSLTLENGSSVPLTGALYLGRNPAAGAEHPGGATLTIDDPRKSVSKTHALIVVQGDTAWLTDLHSTNGCAVLATDGSETVLTPGHAIQVAAGSTIELGEYSVRLVHG